MEIRLIEKERLVSILPLIQQLNPALPEAVLLDRLQEMRSQGYQCGGLYLQEKLVGVCGFWIMTKFYVGKHIEPDNVFILPEYRCRGLGGKLLQWVYAYGKDHGCVASELNCYIENTLGNAFWEHEGFRKIGYHYQKSFS